MAKMHPSEFQSIALRGGEYRERAVVSQLAQQLPDNWDVFHGVDWAGVHQGAHRFGELDAVAVAPSGDLVLLEVKAGHVELSAQGIFKLYASSDEPVKDVSHQVLRQTGAMRSRLNDAGLSQVRLTHLLVLPDFQVGLGTAAYARERIVDASEMPELSARVQADLPHTMPDPDLRARVMDFLCNRLQVQPDPSTHIGQVQATSRALAEGMATWVPRVRHSSNTYVIEATAGSGKTQLALTLLRSAAAQKRRAAYCCFNRPLADHVAHVAPPSVETMTFHERAREVMTRRGMAVDLSVPGMFDQVTLAFLGVADQQTAELDLLIIDESQDFESAWVEAITQRLKPDGVLYVMGDLAQNVYRRELYSLPDSVQITCHQNFRSPRKLVEAINLLRLSTHPVDACTPYEGSAPGIHTYDPQRESAALKALEKCLAQVLADGHRTADIALISFAGRGSSALLARDEVAGLKLHRFTGEFDSAGTAIWTHGELLAETIYRFKGQSAPVVILCEMDFTALDDKALAKLFVGFTRAQFRLECVMTDQAAGLLMQRVEPG